MAQSHRKIFKIAKVIYNMLNEKRKKLHGDIFRMYAAACEVLGNKTYDAPIEIEFLKEKLTGGGVHTTDAFDIEINYLIKKGLFRKYANNRVIATTEGIDEILGKTAFSDRTAHPIQMNKTIGILNKGKDNKFINNEFTGLDIGIQDEGENTLAVDNKFDSHANHIKWWEKTWVQIIFLLGAVAGIVGLILVF